MNTTQGLENDSNVFGLSSEIALASHESVRVHHDEKTGLKAIVAIHETWLGPARGGTQLVAYPTDSDALTDVLRLIASAGGLIQVAAERHGGKASSKARDQITQLADFVQTMLVTAAKDSITAGQAAKTIVDQRLTYTAACS